MKQFTGIVFKALAILVLLLIGCVGCNGVDDDRIPPCPVNINLGDAGVWNTYGVAGFGDWRRFIHTSSERLPSGFPYTSQSATGYGGVLLIRGMDPFSGNTDFPMAYDLSCPVEMKQNVRVQVDGETYEAVCPVCGSHYDVVMGGGSPVSGPASVGDHRYGLRRYACYPTNQGGYIVAN